MTNLEATHFKFIDRLREAAGMHGAVVDLLGLLSDAHESGELVLNNEGDTAAWFRAALMAAKFVDLDQGDDNA